MEHNDDFRKHHKQGVSQHPEDCMCQDCIDLRSNRAQNIDKVMQQENKVREPIWAKTQESKSEINTKANTIKELYRIRRNGRLSIWGTALGAYSAFWEWLLIRILWFKTWNLIGDIVEKTRPENNPYTFWHKPNGYSLIFYSLGIWAWWILVTIIAAVLIGLAIVLALTFLIFWAVMFLVVSAFYPAILVYSIILEFPASVLNRDFTSVNGHETSLDWDGQKRCNIIDAFIIILAGVIIGLIVNHFSSSGWASAAGIFASLVVYVISASIGLLK